MKNLFSIFFTFCLSIIISVSALAQTNHQKKQLRLLENEISSLEFKARQMERGFNLEKAKKVRFLDMKIEDLKRKADPRRVQTEAQLKEAIEAIAKAQMEKDSIKALTYEKLELKKIELKNLHDERRAMIASWYNKDEKIPAEMHAITRNRRQNSNVIRREELVISKIEDNLSAVVPADNKSGYKIILDNKHSQNTVFIIRSVNGGENIAFSLKPRTKEVHYLLPGNYVVEFWINGNKIGHAWTLPIDGQVRYYEGETCFNFAYMSR